MAQTTTYDKLPKSVTRVTREGNDIFIFFSESSLDWYKLTEHTRYVLNHLLASTAKKFLAEHLKTNPDQSKLDDYQIITRIITELSRDPKNFESKERMKEILEEYANLEVL